MGIWREVDSLNRIDCERNNRELGNLNWGFGCREILLWGISFIDWGVLGGYIARIVGKNVCEWWKLIWGGRLW